VGTLTFTILARAAATAAAAAAATATAAAACKGRLSALPLDHKQQAIGQAKLCFTDDAATDLVGKGAMRRIHLNPG
jgi:hypothetical protein